LDDRWWSGVVICFGNWRGIVRIIFAVNFIDTKVEETVDE